MKFNLVAQIVLVFVNWINSGFHGAQAKKTSSLPLITVELLHKNDQVYKYTPPSPGIKYERLSVNSPLSFRNGRIIFWESRGYNIGPRSGTEIKLRLKCEAPYLTKWTITTHSKAKAEDTKPFYHMNYNVKKLPRDREIPLWFPQPNGKNGEFIYNLTELTVNGFGPEFKGGFINCVHRSDESLKSELYIFQRFGANDKIKSVDQISRNVTNLKYIPCIVYDPDVKIQYQQFVNGTKHNGYRFLEANFTSYNWRLGYSKTNGNNYIAGVGRARCALLNDKNYYVEYNITAKTTTLNGAITLTQNSNQDGNHTPSDFVCTFENGRQARATSLRLEQCASPDFCFSGPRPNTYIGSHDSRNNDNGEGDAQTQGKISCSPKIEDFYFTGFSGKIYLLSQSPPPPQEDLFRMSIYEGTKAIRVSCSAVKFLTFEPIEFSVLRYDSDSNKLLKDAFRKDIFPQVSTNVSDGNVKWAESVYTKTVVLGFDHVDGVRGFSCHVPWFNSTEWISVHKNLEFKYEYGDRVLPKAEGELTTSTSTSKKTPGVATSTPTPPPAVETTTTPPENQLLVIACGATVGVLLLFLACCYIHLHYTVEFVCLSSCRKTPPSKNHSTTNNTQEMEDLNPVNNPVLLPSVLKISAKDVTVDERTLVGEGQFSRVFQGVYKQGGGPRKSVVVKVNKLAGDAEQIAALLNDVQMRVLVGDKHPNIANISSVDINREAGKIMILMSLENAKSLRDYLMDRNDQTARERIMRMTPDKRTHFLLTLIKGISNGMAFLHGQKIIHGNLAAENILILPEKNNAVKITGFSYAQELKGKSTYFTKIRSWTTGWEMSGWKWMPMESLRYMEFSKESDVWSFGVVMWEIFSMGASPYATRGGFFKFSMEFVQKLEFGIRLPQPQLAPKEIYKIMEKCWSRYGNNRGDFVELSGFFKNAVDGGKGK